MISNKLDAANSEKKYLLELTTVAEDPTVYQTLALLYQQEDDLENAKKFYEKALFLKPDYVKCYLYLSLVYSLEYDYEKAQELILKAIELTKGSDKVYESYLFLAKLYDKAEIFDKAFEIYAELIQARYENYEMMLNFSLLCLKLNRYIDGFSFYRYRYHPGINKRQKLVASIELLDKNKSIDGKKILIIGEQGNGDVIQFIRYLPMFIKQNAKIFVVVDLLVLDLFKTSYPEISFSNQIPDTADYDYMIPIGDAPYYFSTTYENIPYQEKYLFAGKQSSKNIYEKYFKNEIKKKVGIIWRSNKSNSKNETLKDIKERETYNIPLAVYIKYFKNENIKLYSLQIAVTVEERNLLEQNNIESLGDSFVTFYDNASVIDNLDVVISINTASGLLSGAMGKETIILLAHNTDWRWGISGHTTNWYKTVHIARQVNHEGWESLIKRTTKFEELLSSKTNFINI